MNRREAHVGVLYERTNADGSDANCCTIFSINDRAREPLLPRSYASDGDRRFLFLHVLVHLAAFACTLSGGVCLITTNDVENIRILVSITSGLHGFGIVFLLFFAAWKAHQTEFYLLTAINFASLLGTLLLSCVQFVLTVRKDSHMDTEHFLLYSGIMLQIFAFSLFVACVVGLAANGGNISRTDNNRSTREKELRILRGTELDG